MKSFYLVICLTFSVLGYGQLTIIVDNIPTSTPDNTDLFVAGNFQNWDPGDYYYQLNYDTSEDQYSITIDPSASSILFKFTRGSWATVESTRDGNAIGNRSHTIGGRDTIVLNILGWEDLDGGGNNTSTAAENVIILTDSFYMPQFDRFRRVWIYLPPDYDDTDIDYPVLYMHDGQNCFDAQTSFAGEWQVDETLNNLHTEGVEVAIVVAIDNGQQYRTEEYTPWSHPEYGGGEGEKYIDFIVEHLKPFIDSNYRTLSDRDNTAIMGSSLGGLVSTYGGIAHQDIFSKIGSFSPSYRYSDQAYSQVRTTGMQEEMRIYQLMGGQEGQNNIDNMFRMQDSLLTVGFYGDDLMTILKEDGEHSEWFWAREFESAFIWLFEKDITDINLEPQIVSKTKLYPTPAQDELTIQIKMARQTDVRIEIMNQSGVVLDSISYPTLSPGEHNLKINLEKMRIASGIYFCRIHLDGTSQTLKFIVEK